MEEIFKKLGLSYEVLNGDQEDIRGVCSSHWLWDKSWFGLTSSILTAGQGLTISSNTISINPNFNSSAGSITIDGDPVITKKDLDILKQQIAELTEKLKDK